MRIDKALIRLNYESRRRHTDQLIATVTDLITNNPCHLNPT
jgi:hypothetical protein